MQFSLSFKFLDRRFKTFKPFKSLKPPPYILPRVAGEEQRWGFERSAAVERFERLERVYLVPAAGTAGTDIDLNDTSGSSR